MDVTWPDILQVRLTRRFSSKEEKYLQKYYFLEKVKNFISKVFWHEEFNGAIHFLRSFHFWSELDVSFPDLYGVGGDGGAQKALEQKD